MSEGSDSALFRRIQHDMVPVRADLRILATTDMHMNVLPYNYMTSQPCDRVGLARTASLIATRRAGHPNTLLLDNGDFLQGTPMGDYAARRGNLPRLRRKTHPAIAAMNAMGYDAASLGNHDFNYGLPFLRHVVQDARFPFLAANLRTRFGRDFAGHTILRRRIVTADGQHEHIRIGIIGFLPPQTVEWDRDLSDMLSCDDILTSARQQVPALRAAGAQIVIALAHSGIGSETPRPRMENAATALAAIEGIDAVIAGHTHQVFPGPAFRASAAIDPVRGTLCGTPAVMAGFGGSHLGVIDLALTRDDAAGWRVADFTVRCEAVPADLPAQPEVAAPALHAHRATLRHLRRRIGRIDAPLSSYFSVIGEDPGLRLVNMAQRWHVRRCLRGSKWQDLPVLSAAAPFRAGGRGGPDHYTDVPQGRLSLRGLADLYSFPNRICALVLDGSQLRDWLERSASLFCRVSPGSSDSPLLEEQFPCYNFDVIDGVEWQIDLSQPARYDADGIATNLGRGRIHGLARQGRPVQMQDRFVLATNSYRLSGCGLFSPLARGNEIVLTGEALTRDVLGRYIRRRRRIDIPAAPLWSFRPMPDTTVTFDTGPLGLGHLDRMDADRRARLQYTGPTPEGFARLRLTL